jgi:AcrR family transcriptional regulator
MSRWEPDAVGRLQEAAFELFAEQGFEATTVEEISRRAGLTKRSFFNHFSDKREVLFGPVAEMQRDAVTREIGACPESLPPLEAVVRGLQAAADTVFEARKGLVKRRRDIVDAAPELQERELRKRSGLTDAMAAALRARKVDSDTALLAALAGMVVQQTAIHRWVESTTGRPLREYLSEALHLLRSTAAQTAGEE